MDANIATLVTRTSEVHGEVKVFGNTAHARYVDGVLTFTGIPSNMVVGILAALAGSAILTPPASKDVPKNAAGEPDPWQLSPESQTDVKAQATTPAPATKPKAEKAKKAPKVETPPPPPVAEETEEEEEEETEEEEEEETEEEEEEEGAEDETPLKKVYGSAALTESEFAAVLAMSKLGEVAVVLNHAGAGTVGSLLKSLQVIAGSHTGIQKLVKAGKLEERLKTSLVIRGIMEEEDDLDPTKKIKL